MRRSCLVVGVLGFAVLLGTVISLADNPTDKPPKPVSGKSPQPEKKTAKVAAPPDNRTAVEKIEAALEQPTSIEFVETPLKDVIDYLKDFHHIEIHLDSAAMKEAALPKTRRLSRISRAFRSARP